MFKINSLYILDDTQNQIKSRKLDFEIASLFKEVDQHKRKITNMRNEVVKYTEDFCKNKGESNKLLNENEWIQSLALVELKV